MSTNCADRSRPAHAATSTTVSAVGIPLGAYCVFTLLRDHVAAEFLVFAALTLLSGRFTLKVPSVEAHFSPSEMFVFASVLLFRT